MSEIFSEEFKSYEEARSKIDSFNFGQITESEFGNQTLEILDQDFVVITENTYFKSETTEAYYQYTIEKHVGYCKLRVFETYKHRMISAAKSGNLTEFVEFFTNTDKMKEFSMSTAITHGHWNIVEYLLKNHAVNKDPVWEAIRYDKTEILAKLMARGLPLPEDWLAYCMYSNSILVTEFLIVKEKKHLDFPSSVIQTNWFSKEILKDTKTSRLVQEALQINQ